MKYFVTSDTHAYHNITLKCLNEAGWNPDDSNHKLIVVGDITDRGNEAYTHILWLKNLVDEGKAIVLKGNHDQFILGFLKNIDQSFNWMHNGLKETIDDLDHRTDSFETYCVTSNKEMNTNTFLEWQRITASHIKKELPWLKKWFENLPDYYETEHYIFTHGIVDWKVEDWHKSQMKKYNCKKGWASNHWATPEDWLEFKNYTGKDIVVGHLNASLMRYFIAYQGREGYNYFTFYPDNEIYYDKYRKTYFIDKMTPLTDKVNVLVLEDEEIKHD